MGRLFPAGYRYLLYIDIIKKYISSLKKRPAFDLNLLRVLHKECYNDILQLDSVVKFKSML